MTPTDARDRAFVEAAVRWFLAAKRRRDAERAAEQAENAAPPAKAA